MQAAQCYFSVLMLFGGGALAGLIFDAFGLVKKLARRNLIVSNVADFVCCLLALLVFMICIFHLFSGLFAFFCVLSFVLGAAFEQIFVKNILVFSFKEVYIKTTNRKKRKNHDQV